MHTWIGYWGEGWEVMAVFPRAAILRFVISPIRPLFFTRVRGVLDYPQASFKRFFNTFRSSSPRMVQVICSTSESYCLLPLLLLSCPKGNSKGWAVMCLACANIPKIRRMRSYCSPQLRKRESLITADFVWRRLIIANYVKFQKSTFQRCKSMSCDGDFAQMAKVRFAQDAGNI